MQDFEIVLVESRKAATNV